MKKKSPNQNTEYRILQAHNKSIFDCLSKSEQNRLRKLGYSNNGNIDVIYDTYKLLQNEISLAPICFKYHKRAMRKRKTVKEGYIEYFGGILGDYEEAEKMWEKVNNP